MLSMTLALQAQGDRDSSIIASRGAVLSAPRIDIVLDKDNIIGTNKLSIGFMLDNEWKRWRDVPTLTGLARNTSSKLIRIFDWKSTSPDPCNYWNETAKTGQFDWEELDILVRKIFQIGAEPLFCLGGFTSGQPRIPSGMGINPNTSLPYTASFAAYAQEWVKHFKQVKLPVRFYEIINEPFAYFGWTADYAKLQNYVDLWNTVARAMRAQGSDILLSHDFITARRVLDYWIQYGDDVDFLDLHKYDCSSIGETSDSEMFKRAETSRFITGSSTYGVEDARNKWFNSRGKLLPVISSETNFDSTWSNGSDPSIQKMVGAVWIALVLRTGVLKGLDYNIYFQFASSKTYNVAKPSGGFGFGMVNLDDNRPWYPYYVNEWFGSNIDVGDSILYSNSSSEDVRSLAWQHRDKLNVLLISKTNGARSVYLRGIEGLINVHFIDSTISFVTPQRQYRVMNATDALVTKGYTVALLQIKS